jgi:hypothetical protein
MPSAGRRRCGKYVHSPWKNYYATRARKAEGVGCLVFRVAFNKEDRPSIPNTGHRKKRSAGKLSLQVNCEPLDLQLDPVAQVRDAMRKVLSAVEELTLHLKWNRCCQMLDFRSWSSDQPSRVFTFPPGKSNLACIGDTMVQNRQGTCTIATQLFMLRLVE